MGREAYRGDLGSVPWGLCVRGHAFSFEAPGAGRSGSFRDSTSRTSAQNMRSSPFDHRPSSRGRGRAVSVRAAILNVPRSHRRYRRRRRESNLRCCALGRGTLEAVSAHRVWCGTFSPWYRSRPRAPTRNPNPDPNRARLAAQECFGLRSASRRIVGLSAPPLEPTPS